MPGREGFTWAAGGGTPTWKRRRGCAEPIRLPPTAPPPAAPAGHRQIKASGWPGAPSSATGTARRARRCHRAPDPPPGQEPTWGRAKTSHCGRAALRLRPLHWNKGLVFIFKGNGSFFSEKMPFFPIYGGTLHENWCLETRRFLLASTSLPQGRKREGSKTNPVKGKRGL